MIKKLNLGESIIVVAKKFKIFASPEDALKSLEEVTAGLMKKEYRDPEANTVYRVGDKVTMKTEFKPAAKFQISEIYVVGSNVVLALTKPGSNHKIGFLSILRLLFSHIF